MQGAQKKFNNSDIVVGTLFPQVHFSHILKISQISKKSSCKCLCRTQLANTNNLKTKIKIMSGSCLDTTKNRPLKNERIMLLLLDGYDLPQVAFKLVNKGYRKLHFQVMNFDVIK